MVVWYRCGNLIARDFISQCMNYMIIKRKARPHRKSLQYAEPAGDLFLHQYLKYTNLQQLYLCIEHGFCYSTFKCKKTSLIILLHEIKCLAQHSQT